MTAEPQPPQLPQQQPYYPPPAAPQPYPAPPPAPARTASRAASTSLILGILSLFTAVCLIGFAFAPLAILLGIVGLNHTAQPNVTGREAAWIGIILGALVMLGGGGWAIVSTFGS